MSETPVGWETTTLGQLGRYLNGRGFKKSEWRDSGRPIIRIQNLTGSGNSYNYFQGDVEERYVARPGDLLVSWAATLGAFIWSGPEAVVNQHIFKVESNINLKFHKYLLDYKLEELMRHTHGSGMVHITKGSFDSLPVMLPPPAVQQKIVDLLEDHLSRLDAAAHTLDHAQYSLVGLREKAVRDAITGVGVSGPRDSDVPTAEGVEDGTLASLPRGWRWLRLRDVAEVVGGVTKDAGRQSDPAFVEVPYLRVANVQRGALTLDKITCIRVSSSKAEALRLIPGDVLMNEGGDRDKLGRGWIWEGQVEDCIHQNHVFRARVVDGLLHPKLLSWAANTIGGRWCEQNGKQSVNLASISLNKIRLMPVPVAPFELQELMVQRLDGALTGCDRLQEALDVQRLRLTSLRRSLLAAAFSGQLVNAAALEGLHV